MKYLPRLKLKGQIGAGGHLIFDGVRIGERPFVVALDGRHVRFLLALARHWCACADDEVDTGPPFVTVAQIAAEFYEEGEFAIPPGPGSVRAYAAQINTLIRNATPAGTKAPKVHETGRLLGYRLVEDLRISMLEGPTGPFPAAAALELRSLSASSCSSPPQGKAG